MAPAVSCSGSGEGGAAVMLIDGPGNCVQTSGLRMAASDIYQITETTTEN